jgi:uncharacterized membrane protein YkoI
MSTKGENMQIHPMLVATVLMMGLAGAVVGCKSTGEGKETRVSVAELPEPARAAVNKLTAGGQMEKIDKEIEKGKVVYDVEATVGGKHVEYTIGADGAVLGTETSIEFSALPEPVRLAAEKHFGTTSGLKAMKGVEDGKTHYEVEGTKNGKKSEVTFDPTGKRTE